MIESQRAIEAEANEAALETLKAQHEERASVMLLSSEAGEAELKAQADRLQTCLGGLRRVLSSSEARGTGLRTRVKGLQARLNEGRFAFLRGAGKLSCKLGWSKAGLLSKKEDMS